MYVYVYVCVCMYVCMYVYVLVLVYVYAHMHTHTHMHTHIQIMKESDLEGPLKTLFEKNGWPSAAHAEYHVAVFNSYGKSRFFGHA